VRRAGLALCVLLVACGAPQERAHEAGGGDRGGGVAPDAGAAPDGAHDAVHDAGVAVAPAPDAGPALVLDRYAEPSDCARRAGLMDERLDLALDTHFATNGLPVLERADGLGRPPGVLVEITSVDDLAAVVARAKKQRKKKNQPFVLALRSSLPVEPLWPFLLQLSAVGEVRLLVNVPRPPRVPLPTPEAPPWAREALARLERQPSAAALADATKLAVGSCGAAIEVFGHVANANPAEVRYTFKELPEAIMACRCRGLDVDALELFVLAVVQIIETREGWIAARFEAGGARVPLAGDVRVYDLVDGLAPLSADERRRGVELVFEGPVTP
jgi:hypothetical protein